MHGRSKGMDNYEGLVKMYDEEIFISKKTKEGYDKVLKRIDPLLCGWASRAYMPGYSFEDIKQEVSLIAIEGINAYDPTKKVKLSSFLQTHIKYKVISKIKSLNKLSNDASLLKLSDEQSFCSCESPEIDSYDNICRKCDYQPKPEYRSSRSEYSFSSLNKDFLTSGGEVAPYDSFVSNSDNFYFDGVDDFDKADIKIILERLEESLDEKTFKILKLVWIDGHSKEYAANQIGISGWAASQKLKKLLKNNIISDLLSDIRLKSLDIKDE